MGFNSAFKGLLDGVYSIKYGNLFTINTEIPLQTHFESVGANLYFHTRVVGMETFKMIWLRRDGDLT